MTIEGQDLKPLFRVLAGRMQAARDELSALDRAIGDGDHGVTMAIGWTAVQEAVDALEAPDMATVFRTAGQAFLQAVGATVGPLYATGLLDMAQWCRDHETLESSDALPLFAAFVGGLSRRGRAVVGQKTMMDTWLPAYQAFEAGWSHGATTAARDALQAGAAGCRATEAMKAGTGRAGRLGERSRGHQDPGAQSAYLLLETTIHWFLSGPVDEQ